MMDDIVHPFIDAGYRFQLISQILAALGPRYVFPDVAARMVQEIQRRQEGGDYDDVDDGAALAATLTAHLQEVSHDLHRQIRYSSQPKPVSEGTLYDDSGWVAAYLVDAANDNYGVQRVERLPGNVGCLQLTSLDDAEYTADAVAAAMTVLANTSALIIDVRRSNGGAPTGVAFLCSYLFSPEPVHLNDVYCRESSTTQQYWTLPHIPGRRYLDRPVYVLTSSKTPSAAEELAYDLQVLGRATVVGETTVGAANPVELYQLTPHFALQLPTCQTVNPISGTNWEGVGVTPDIVVPQEEALRTAHREALQAVLKSLEDVPGGSSDALNREVRGALKNQDTCPPQGLAAPPLRN